jgi:pantoate--beta-alanine ligase
MKGCSEMSLSVMKQVASLRHWIAGQKAAGHRIAFVPTMGNLHEGHLDLVRSAQAENDKLVVSIFVNPLQFGPHEDFDRYPRTPEADLEKLQSLGVDALFMPGVEELYPQAKQGQSVETRIALGGLANQLCGAHRPGHFDGMATVVAKLFNIVQPDAAYFGKKDYQQLTLIRQFVADLNFPLEIHGVATRREASGLALSSRNQYLSSDEKTKALTLYQSLKAITQALDAGERDYAQLEQKACAQLAIAGFVVDYVAIRQAADLALPAADCQHWVVLGAAKMGATRLIDNLEVKHGQVC